VSGALAAVTLAGNNELSNLSVVAQSAGGAITGVAMPSGGGVTLRGVSIQATAGQAAVTGISVTGGELLLFDSFVNGRATGNSAAYAVRVAMGGTARLSNSYLRAWSELASTGDVAALELFDASFAELHGGNITVQPGAGNGYGLELHNTSGARVFGTDVFILGGGPNSIGVVLNDSSNAEVLSGVLMVLATGTYAQVALVNSPSAGLTLRGVTANAQTSATTAGCTAYGVNNFGTANVDSSTIDVFLGTTCSNLGLASQGTGATLTVRNSHITSQTYAIWNSSTVPVRVAATELDAPVLTNGGLATCIGSYKSDFTATTASCN
jgi:hypothetical protein